MVTNAPSGIIDPFQNAASRKVPVSALTWATTGVAPTHEVAFSLAMGTTKREQ